MIFIAIVIGCILGAVIGIYAPMVSYTYSGYLAIVITGSAPRMGMNNFILTYVD